MTTKELQDLLYENGFRAEIREEAGFISVITDNPVSEGLQARIRLHTSAGVKVNFITADKTKIPVPKVLANWLKNTKSGMV